MLALDGQLQLVDEGAAEEHAERVADLRLSRRSGEQ
jgi:hypothetical protein